MPGIVDLRVVILKSTHECLLVQRRRNSQRTATRQVPVQGDAGTVPGCLRHRVIQRQAGSQIDPFPRPMLERVEEFDRPHQVRRQLLQHQPTLGKRLGDQPEVEHLQIAQPSVDQFAGAAGRPGGEVARLNQAGPKAAGSGIQRGAGTDHAAADDQDVHRRLGHIG
ncbi:hypothetical protein MAIC_57190 [Mycolicibacterium aichiense]|uniref:Uncharacterized protein n=1 Tax=Mycolicibacterium aichiense TaxID=1799 RepID=A0AAD1HTX0_9MYCO|nr:hypothetical protein MAIC_57190 [Mycolicibacterium aichiense]